MKPIRYIHAAVLALLTSLPLMAQNNIADVLLQIEANNVSLQAMRHENEALRQQNRSEITLPDPEVGFEYGWGNAATSDRINVSVTQSFDLATVSGLKVKMAKEQDLMNDWQYRAERRRILLEAKQLCLDLIYYNALQEELDKRRKYAESMLEHQNKRMAQGESGRIEHNNFVLSVAEIQGECAQLDAERQNLLTKLKALNGGNDLMVNFKTYENLNMSENFEDWHERAQTDNPALGYAEQSLMVQQRQLSLSKSRWLPSISLGYAGEFTGDEKLNGVSVGVSVPLWANLHQVNQAKASVQAARSRQEESRQQFDSELEILFRQTLGLKKIADIYRSTLNASDNRELINKALEEGSISVLDYILEMNLYYDALKRTLDAERNYHKAHAELSAFEL